MWPLVTQFFQWGDLVNPKRNMYLVLIIFLVITVYYIQKLPIIGFMIESFPFISSFLYPEGQVTEHMQGQLTWWGITSFVLSLSTLLIAFVILMENRHPSKTIAWLIVLILFPILGFFLYVLIGQNYRRKRRFKRKEAYTVGEIEDLMNMQLALVREEGYWEDKRLDEKKNLLRLTLHNSEAPFTTNNETEVLTNGEAKFEALKAALRLATDHIHLEYYIFRDDEISTEIQQILIEKALEGVEVRFIVDGVGSHSLSPRFVRAMEKAKIKFAVFYPVIFPFINKLNYRNHRKIVIIDGKVGFLGGINVGDEYLHKDPKLGFWRDTHLKIQGDAVYFLQIIFAKDWRFLTGEDIEDSRYFPSCCKEGDQLIQIASSGPDADWESILQVYFTAIISATKSIYITTPYLVPDESIFMALKTAAMSGVKVQIIVPAKPDHQLVFWASRAYYQELLDSGVRIFEYEKGFIHAKVLIVDDIVSSVGTANMDIRSFQLNFEINALIYDEGIAKRLLEDFHEDLKHCREIDPEIFSQRGIKQKFKESGAKLVSPLL